MAAVMGSFADVSAAAHLPAPAAARIAEVAGARAASRRSGSKASLPRSRIARACWRSSSLRSARSDALGEAASRALWRAVRDVAPFAAAGPAGRRDRLAHLHGAVGAAPRSAARSSPRPGAEIMYDWAGGLVWAALPASDDAGASLVRATVAAAGGHATLIRAPAAVRASVEVFAPEPARPCGIDEARARELRSAGRAQCRAHVGGRVDMQTSFTLAQLADPHVAESEKILRACVHCGFCTATCPTYVLDGNELDSPRGRIYLIKDMLENERPATAEVVQHIDRCLSCLACMTTCPSGVHYMHLVDHARAHIEETYRRPAARAPAARDARRG